MIKKVILLFAFIFAIGTTVQASNERWVPMYNMYYDARNNTKPFFKKQNTPSHYVDMQSARYDNKTQKITFWTKVSNTIDRKKEVLTEYEFDLNTWEKKELKTVYRDGHSTSTDKWVRNIIFSIEGPDEFEIKQLCDYFNIANRFKTSPHQWKYLASQKISDTPGGKIFYHTEDWLICTDLYMKTYKPGVAKVFIKKIRSNKNDILGPYLNMSEPYFVDFNRHSVYRQLFGVVEEDNIIPESMEEAIYKETLNMLSK